MFFKPHFKLFFICFTPLEELKTEKEQRLHLPKPRIFQVFVHKYKKVKSLENFPFIKSFSFLTLKTMGQPRGAAG